VQEFGRAGMSGDSLDRDKSGSGKIGLPIRIEEVKNRLFGLVCEEKTALPDQFLGHKVEVLCVLGFRSFTKCDGGDCILPEVELAGTKCPPSFCECTVSPVFCGYHEDVGTLVHALAKLGD